MDAETKHRLMDATRPLLDGDDWAAIERLWEPFARAGDVEAKGRLAYLYLFYGFDEGPEKDRELDEMARGAAAQGHPDASWALAVLQPSGPDRDRMMRKAAELGNRYAQRELGALYATGNWGEGPKDEVLAVHWYTLAAQQGEDDAQYNLGFMYLLGEGAGPDIDKGLYWLRLSAGQGNTCAIQLLADVFGNGSCGVPKDPAEAEQWNRRLRE